jgi:FixJ family two-component response regulator
MIRGGVGITPVYDIQAMLVMQKNIPAAAHRETRRKDDKLPEPLIAVIDDDEPFRTALIESLCSFGYTARGFESAEHFIATDEQAPCDCIVTDIHMPGMSGLDLKRLLIDRGSLTPVILITARAEPGLEDRAISAGAIGLLQKPFKSDVLISCLEKALKA